MTETDGRAANVGMTNGGMMGGTWTHAFYSAQTGKRRHEIPCLGSNDAAGLGRR